MSNAFEEVGSEVAGTSKDIPDDIDEHFVYVSEYMSGCGKKIRRRHWSKSGLQDFRSDWSYEIGFCKMLGKKPTIRHIRQKLSEMPLVKAR